MIKIKSEDELLDESVRKKLIESFDSPENLRRKAEAYKAYQCLKDKTVHYVVERLFCQFDEITVSEMLYALSNISVLRKVIDKLARVYANGVNRTMKSVKDTKSIEQIAEYLDLNAMMKKANRYFRTFKNTLVYVKPIQNDEDKYDITVDAVPPFKYDAIEDPKNPKKALGIVLSDYVAKQPRYYSIIDAAYAGRNSSGGTSVVRKKGDENKAVLVSAYSSTTGINQPKEDEKDPRQFIWWTKNYHFTTDSKGAIIESDQFVNEKRTENLISKMPFVNLVVDQDDGYWAEGGEDLVETGISLNTQISNSKHIGVLQGYGQLYMTGKDLPKSVKTGPTQCIQLSVADKDEPAPQIGFLSANPPLSELRSQIEMETALMLTTNNLSTSGFAANLQGGKDFASGIALAIDKSESVEDVGEQSQEFVQKEPKIFVLVKDWYDVFKEAKVLSEEASVLKMPAKPELVQVSFPSPKPVMSENELLDIYEKRKKLGINTMIEIIKRDDPSLSDEEAEAKLQKIIEEKKKRSEMMGFNGDSVNGDQSNRSPGVEQPNDDDPGSNIASEDDRRSQDED